MCESFVPNNVYCLVSLLVSILYLIYGFMGGWSQQRRLLTIHITILDLEMFMVVARKLGSFFFPL